MKDKLFFTKTYLMRRSNGANRAYWTKYFKSLLPDDINYFDYKRRHESFDDLFPICTFLSLRKKRGVIIYHYNPNLVSIEEESYVKYMTAWTSQRKIDGNRINLLTIYMISSSNNIKTAKNLIQAWFFQKGNVKKIIQEIYNSQSKPPKDFE